MAPLHLATPTPRDRVLSVVLAIILLAIGFFPTKTQYGKLKDLLKQRQTAITSLKELTSQQNNLKKFQEEWDKVKTNEEMNKLAILLPQDPSLPDLAVNLEAIAKSSGLILYSFSTSLAPASPGLKDVQALSLSVSLNGKIDYFLLKTILTAFEENLRIFEIEGFTYTPSQPSLSLQIKTFFLPPSAIKNSPSSPDLNPSQNLENPKPRYL